MCCREILDFNRFLIQRMIFWKANLVISKWSVWKLVQTSIYQYFFYSIFFLHESAKWVTVRILKSNEQGLQKCVQKKQYNDAKTPILKRWGLSIVIWEKFKLWHASKQRFWSIKNSYHQNLRSVGQKWEKNIWKFDSRKKFFLLSKWNKQNNILVSLCAGCKTYWKNLLKHLSLIINFFFKMGTLFEMFIWPFQKSFHWRRLNYNRTILWN